MRFPKWMRKKPPDKAFFQIKKDLKEDLINTVCEEASCPNIYECFQRGCATFLILGKKCTRRCRFCNISYKKKDIFFDEKEGEKIAFFARRLKLKHIVVTMVTRDDLEDGGANHFFLCIKIIKKYNPSSKIEVLTSDFSGNFKSLDIILNSKINIFSHNLETVEKLTPFIRCNSSYRLSLNILKYAKKNKSTLLVKTSIMVGLGETFDQVIQTIDDIKNCCDILNIGQYLQPSKANISVKKFIRPDVFKRYEKYAYSVGIKKVFAKPFVRSSYYADKI